MNRLNHDYEPIMKLVNITSLQNSRAINDFKFIFKLIIKEINCPELLSKIEFFSPYNPIRTSSVNNIFVINNVKLPFSTINRISFLANLNRKWIKFKNLTPYQFVTLLHKNKILLNPS